jgi:hypothetical protein
MPSFHDWKKSVVHIECVTDSEKMDLKWRDFVRRVRDGKANKEEFLNMKWTLRDLRYRGTAVFVEHKERYYLVTARHVVHDLVRAKHEFESRAIVHTSGSSEGVGS